MSKLNKDTKCDMDYINCPIHIRIRCPNAEACYKLKSNQLKDKIDFRAYSRTKVKKDAIFER